MVLCDGSTGKRLGFDLRTRNRFIICNIHVGDPFAQKQLQIPVPAVDGTTKIGNRIMPVSLTATFEALGHYLTNQDYPAFFVTLNSNTELGFSCSHKKCL